MAAIMIGRVATPGFQGSETGVERRLQLLSRASAQVRDSGSGSISINIKENIVIILIKYGKYRIET
jgi:hypothetical protein